jgi:hypothetical protein
MNHTFATEGKNSCAVFHVVRDECDQVSKWLSLLEALEFLNDMRDMHPQREYVLLFRVDA